MRKFVYGGQLALVVGGIVLASGAALAVWAAAGVKFSDFIGGTEGLVSSAMRLTGALLVLWGFAAVHMRQADRAGWFGLVALLLAGLNLVVNAAWMFSDLFIAPTFAVLTPHALNGPAPMPGRIDAGFMIAWVANVASLLFGIAVLRAKVYRRTCALFFMLTGALFFVPMPFDGPAYEVAVGLLFATAGFFAVRTATPAPVSFEESALVPTSAS